MVKSTGRLTWPLPSLIFEIISLVAKDPEVQKITVRKAIQEPSFREKLRKMLS